MGIGKNQPKKVGAIVGLLGSIKAHERIEITIKSFQVSALRHTIGILVTITDLILWPSNNGRVLFSRPNKLKVFYFKNRPYIHQLIRIRRASVLSATK
jgi:hypothetical protein